MPGIAQRINKISEDSMDSDYQNPMVGNGIVPFHSCNGSSGSNDGFWLKHSDDVEKAFREGTARQNAHEFFLCLAFKAARGTLARGVQGNYNFREACV